HGQAGEVELGAGDRSPRAIAATAAKRVGVDDGENASRLIRHERSDDPACKLVASGSVREDEHAVAPRACEYRGSGHGPILRSAAPYRSLRGTCAVGSRFPLSNARSTFPLARYGRLPVSYATIPHRRVLVQ